MRTKRRQVNKAQKVDIPIFDSKETIVFNSSNKKAHFIIMGFGSEKKAKDKFPIINQIYKDKLGGAIIEKNFTIAFSAIRHHCSEPLEMALTQEEVNKLQSDLKIFCHLHGKTLIARVTENLEK